MTHAAAMEGDGCDRPGLRDGLEIADFSAVFDGLDFGITRSALAGGGRVRGIVVPGAVAWSRKQVDELEAIAKGAGALGLLRVKKAGGEYDGPIAKFLTDAAKGARARDGGAP